MMDAKEEALALCQKMAWVSVGDEKIHDGISLPFHIAKKCALIAVNVLIEEQTMWQNGQPDPVLYWQSVKEELIKLEL